MKNFVDFVTDIAKDNKLMQEAMDKLHGSDHAGISAWFKSKGYEVSEADSKKLKESKDAIKKSAEVGITY